jgi:hypothetical protein
MSPSLRFLQLPNYGILLLKIAFGKTRAVKPRGAVKPSPTREALKLAGEKVLRNAGRKRAG